MQAWGVVLAALALAAAAVPGAAPAAGEGGAYARLEALALERSGGDLGLAGTLRGPMGVETISGHEFLALVQAATHRLGAPAPQADHAVAPESFGVGDQALSGASAWPFCDAASIFTYSFGAIQVTPNPTPVPLPLGGANICGGTYGPTESYADVTFVVPEAGVLLACTAAQVMVGGDAPVGLLGGSDCTWSVACFSGEGMYYSAAFFGLHFDYVLGVRGTVVAGHEGMDLTACAPGLYPPGV